jgi:hypothetical protein
MFHTKLALAYFWESLDSIYNKVEVLLDVEDADDNKP